MGRPLSEPPLGHCKVCGGKVQSRNLCHSHYRAMRESGELPKVPPAPKVCTECGGTAVSKGLCWKHYKRKRRKENNKPCQDGKKHQWLITGRCRVCQMEK